MERRTKQNSGFTLIEIMVSMAIGSLVIAGIYGVYTIQQRSYTVQEQVSEMQQKGRAAQDFMVRDIRMVGYDDDDNNCTSDGISKAEAELFEFETCDVDGNRVTVQYGMYDAYLDSNQNDGVMNDLYREVDGGTRQLIAEGIDALEFLYLDADSAPLGTVVTGAAELDRIRSVRISMLLRAAYPDARHTDTILHEPASGNTNWDIKSTAGNPPGDHYHRRLLITTVKLRNIGL